MDLISVLSTIISIFINPLVKIYNKFFGIYLIKDKEMKDYLKKAKKKLKAKNYVACLVNIAKAFGLFNNKVRRAYKKVSKPLDIVYAIIPFETLVSKKFIDVNYKDYKRFETLIPRNIYIENGRIWPDTKNILVNFKNENAPENSRFCLEFLIDLILKNQNELIE